MLTNISNIFKCNFMILFYYYFFNLLQGTGLIMISFPNRVECKYLKFFLIYYQYKYFFLLFLKKSV